LVLNLKLEKEEAEEAELVLGDKVVK